MSDWLLAGIVTLVVVAGFSLSYVINKNHFLNEEIERRRKLLIKLREENKELQKEKSDLSTKNLALSGALGDKIADLFTDGNTQPVNLEVSTTAVHEIHPPDDFHKRTFLVETVVIAIPQY